MLWASVTGRPPRRAARTVPGTPPPPGIDATPARSRARSPRALFRSSRTSFDGGLRTTPARSARTVPRTTTGAAPIEHRYTYDIAGNAVYSTDMKVATASAFDAQGREIATMNADGTKTERQHDAAGRPTQIETKSPTGATVEKSSMSFSDTGRLSQSTSVVDSSASRVTQVGWERFLLSLD